MPLPPDVDAICKMLIATVLTPYKFPIDLISPIASLHAAGKNKQPYVEINVDNAYASRCSFLPPSPGATLYLPQNFFFSVNIDNFRVVACITSTRNLHVSRSLSVTISLRHRRTSFNSRITITSAHLIRTNNLSYVGAEVHSTGEQKLLKKLKMYTNTISINRNAV